MKKVAKKRNPQDVTLRNVQAANKILMVLRQRLRAIEARIDALERRA